MKTASVLVGVAHAATLIALAHAGGDFADADFALAGVSAFDGSQGTTPVPTKPTTKIPGGFQGNQGNQGGIIPTKPVPTTAPPTSNPPATVTPTPEPSATSTPAPSPTSQVKDLCTAKVFTAAVATNKPLQSCATESKYAFFNAVEPPTKAQMDVMCGSANCKDALQVALKDDPADCILPLNRLLLRAEIFDRISTYCKSGEIVAAPPKPTLPTVPDLPLPTPKPVPSPGPAPVLPSPFCTAQQLAPVTKATKDLTQCSTDSGFSFVPLTRPSPEVVTKMCASASCVKVFTAALGASPTECTVPLGGVQYVSELLNVVGSACKLTGSTPAPSGTTTPSPSGTATPAPSGTATPAPSGTVTPTPTSPTKMCEAKLLASLLYTNTEFVSCATSTQFPLAGFSSAPTKEQMDKFCASETCSKAFASALASSPAECTIPLGRLSLRADFLDRVTSYCKTGVVPPATTPVTPAPVPLPSPAPVPSPGPAPVFPSPFCTAQQLAPVTKATEDLTQCSKDAGFSFVPLARPSSEVVTKMCASASCVKVFTAALSANPTECTVPLGGVQYVSEFLNVVGSACKLTPTTPTPSGTVTPTPSGTATPAPSGTMTPTPTTTQPTTPVTMCEAKLLASLLYTNTEFVSCATSTQFPLAGFSAAPSKEQMDKFCASETCSKAFASALASSPAECTIPLGRLSLRADFLDRVTSYCKTGVVPPATTPVTPAPVPLPSPAPVPSPGPAPVSPSPFCTAQQLTPVTKVTEDLTQCSKDAGFSFVPLARPSSEVVTKMCASASCVKVFTAALGANPTECTVPLGGVQYVADVLSVVGSACKLSPTTPAPTTPSPTTPVPTTPSPTTPVPTTPSPTTPEPTKPSPTTPKPTKPGPVAGDPCGNLHDGPAACPQGQYCQPWNPYYYQCRSIDAKCGLPEVDVDFNGDDMASLSVTLPEECCDKCHATPGCKAYTFINWNADAKPMCYLKKGSGKKQKLTGAVSAMVEAPVCSVASGGQCGSDADGAKCCPSGEYCQPWNPFYYQCRPAPVKCGLQEIGVDYAGDDLQTVYGLLPWECCDKCADTAGCKAYTFVNHNADGRTACYLKKGTGRKQTKVGAVSSTVLNPKPACTTPEYGACGSAASGTTCCPSGFYCQAWNPTYYQCMPAPAQCSQQFTNVDFAGNDLETVYGVKPDECCAKCAATKNCRAYTFVNANPGRPACYLKSSAAGKTTLSGAVSGILN
jgi:hypothetical protein